MKGSRTASRDAGFGNGGNSSQQKRKNGRGSGDKWTNNRKLDRKSSRGMIYENEELRLRTININAEVERGQNDIRKLRRENEQLKREIWSLRDEYDKLHQFLSTNRNSCENLGEKTQNSDTQTEDSCDTCKEIDSDCEKLKFKNCDPTQETSNATDAVYLMTSGIQCYNNIHTPTTVAFNTSPLVGNKKVSLIKENHTVGGANNGRRGGRPKLILSSPEFNIFEKNSLEKFHHNQYSESQNKYVQQSLSSASSHRCPGYEKDIVKSSSKNDVHRINFDHLSIVSEENLTNTDSSNGSYIQHYPHYQDVQTCNGIQKDQMTITNQVHFDDSSNSIENKNANYLIRGTTLPQLNFDFLPSCNTAKKIPNSHILKEIGKTEEDISPVSTATTNFITTTIPPLAHFENICDEKFLLTQKDDLNCKEAIATVGQKSSDNNDNSNSNDNNFKNNSGKNNLFDIKGPKHFFSPIKPTSEVIAIQIQPAQQPLANANNLGHETVAKENAASAALLASSVFGDKPFKPILPTPSSSISSAELPSISQVEMELGPPDIWVANALPKSNNQIVSINTTSKCDDSFFQNGGNLEELLQDIQCFSNSIPKKTLQYHQQPKTFTTFQHCSTTTTPNNNDVKCKKHMSKSSSDNQILKSSLMENNHEPYKSPVPLHRSEINLVLNYHVDADNTNVPTNKKKRLQSIQYNNQMPSNATQMDNNSLDLNFASKLLPKPMTLFPKHLPYLGYEDMLMSAPAVTPEFSSSSLLKSMQLHSLFPAPSTLPICTDYNFQQQQMVLGLGSDPILSNQPKLSMLMTPTASHEREIKKKINLGLKQNATVSNDAADSTRQKLSIVPLQTTGIATAIEKSTTIIDENSIKKQTTSANNFAASDIECSARFKAQSISNNELIDHRQAAVGLSSAVSKQSQSTPNSPHSIGKRLHHNNNKQSEQTHCSTGNSREGCNNNNVAHSHSHRHSHYHHQNNIKRKLSYESSRSTSGLSLTNGVLADGVITSSSSILLQHQDGISESTKPGSAIKSRLRRHSDGTVISSAYHRCRSQQPDGDDIGFSFNGSTSKANRLLYNNHFKQSISSIHGDHHIYLSSNGNNRATATSTSERNSNNSLVSSIESSNSLNIGSSLPRRKMSNISHSSTKIPWCGCWGNGCL